MSDDITKLILENVKELNHKADKTAVDIVEIKSDVNYHIKRTDLLQEQVEIFKNDSHTRLNKLENFSSKFHYLGWILSGIMAIVKLAKELHLF